MNKLLIVLLLLLPVVTEAYKDAKLSLAHIKLYNQIRRAKPNIDSKYASHLVESIYEVSRAFKLDPRILTAILAQESKFDLKAYNARTNDVGLSQINYKTAKAYNFNIKKLRTDSRYAIWAAGIVLKDFSKSHPKDKDAWTYYNSSRPDKRAKYKRLVTRYM